MHIVNMGGEIQLRRKIYAVKSHRTPIRSNFSSIFVNISGGSEIQFLLPKTME